MGSLFSGSDSSSNVERVRVPTVDDLRVELEPLVQQGVISPQQLEVILLEQTAYDEIQEDPRLRASQIGALNELENIVNEGGLDARARARLGDVQAAQAAQNRGAQQAILSNARARGIGGSDVETVARLVAAQEAATRGAAAGRDTAAQAEARRDQAIAQQSQLAAAIRGQDYQREQQKAEARDIIDRFNAANRQDAARYNVGAANAAQASNLAELQRVADANVGLRNQEETYNRGLPLDIYNARLGKARQVDAGDAAAQQRRDETVTGVGTTIAAVAPYFFSDERTKRDVKPIDSDEILSELTGVEYRYKPPLDDGEEHASVMAGDLEKVAPQAVVEGPGGMKMVDTREASMVALGALADLNDRVKELEARRA